MAKIVEGENRRRPGRWLLDYRDSTGTRRLMTFRNKEDAEAALDELRRPLSVSADLDVSAVGPGLKTYFLLNPETRRLKIGRTQDIKARVFALETAAGTRLKLIGVLEGDHEQAWHHRFSDRVFGEWFNVSGRVLVAINETFGVHIRAKASPLDLALADETKRHKTRVASLCSEFATKTNKKRPSAAAVSDCLPRAAVSEPTPGLSEAGSIHQPMTCKEVTSR
jgi:hypothetical protein